MTLKNFLNMIEMQMGRQSEGLIIQLMNDGLDEIAATKQNYQVSATETLTSKQRYYELADRMIDIMRVEILDTNNRYVRIPKLVDAHNLRKDDTDTDGSDGDGANSTVN
tara:strand:+ start:575 stop:901 length:327 start_codon:yes stop_codon:yes gene_type:complete